MKLAKLSPDEQKALVPENLMFLAYRGSIAHGMYVPNTDPNSIDDKDIMGVYFADPSHYIGVRKNKDTKELWYKEWDCVYYEFLKMLGLLIKGNPNVLSLLWVNDNYVLQTSESWKKIVDIRDAFTCRNVYHSFTGYAHGQIHRMTHVNFEGYMGEKRKSLVDKYGYDVKNAAHCIRLLRMCIEYLTEGKLYVERTYDATELLEIKRGEWTLEKVKEESDRLFKLSQEAYIRSTLPTNPDIERINKVATEVLRNYIVSRA